MALKISIFKFLIFFCFFYSSLTFSQNIIKGNAKIIDGDTIHIGKEKIRLHGIDAPEINQICTINNQIWKCGLESKRSLINIILNQVVQCNILETDKYKRAVAVCFANDLNLNRYMVKNGWAIAYRYYSLNYVIDEEFAKKRKLGIWKGQFIEPYIFRKKN